MGEQNSEPLEGLDEAVVVRLHNGTATKNDEIAKLEHWRRVASEHGDVARVEELDAQISVMRIGE